MELKVDDSDNRNRQNLYRGIGRILSSPLTAVCLMAVLALACVVGVLLPKELAHYHVYGRAWFRILLGLLGLDIAVCILHRLRSGLAGAWSVSLHGGFLLILVGGLVTFLTAERGSLILREGESADSFISSEPGWEPVALGFSVRLVDFRIEYYPPVQYVTVKRAGTVIRRLPLHPPAPVTIPGTCWTLEDTVLTSPEKPLLEVILPSGMKREFPASVGTSLQIAPDTLIEVLRFDPCLKTDSRAGEVVTDAVHFGNPALEVRLLRKGEQKARFWLFAKLPGFFWQPDKENEPDTLAFELRFLHPSVPILSGMLRSETGPYPVRLTSSGFFQLPDEADVLLGYEREADRPKELESAVAVVREGEVIATHVIRVNDPLVYGGVKFLQADFDKEGRRWTAFAVSRDSGVYIVFAGYAVLLLGMMGRFYVRPALNRRRKEELAEGGGDGRT